MKIVFEDKSREYDIRYVRKFLLLPRYFHHINTFIWLESVILVQKKLNGYWTTINLKQKNETIN